MNAIVPLNIAALRVNNNDSTNIVSQFQGKTAVFNQMPWKDPNNSYPNLASTGDKIYRSLSVNAGGSPVFSPADPLGVGVHLHWELPDYFRKGKQQTQGGNLVFPHAPNRWMVVRYLSIYNANTQTYGPVTSKTWIVESDYLSPTITTDDYGVMRPTISVPVPATPEFKSQPYMYMGRVVEYNNWNPASEPLTSYLPNYTGSDGQSLYLTSIGFVGSYFGSYYPECCSVFGFWDSFADMPEIFSAITTNNPGIQFRTTYQVVGWVNETPTDPLAGIVGQVTTQYNQYLAKCNANQVNPAKTPVDFFNLITSKNMKWAFNKQDVSCTLNPDFSINTLNLPTQTLCAGTAQEIVWNMLTNTGTTYFLQSTGNNPVIWPAQTEIAVGNSTEEALAALLKYDMGQQTTDPNVLTNYEYLLDALQLGLLADLEKTPNTLISLEEALHNNGFSSQSGGYLWIIDKTPNTNSNTAPDPNAQVTLPLDLAEQLALLNQAQKKYDQGRNALNIMRKQLFMDWIRYIKIYTGESLDPSDPNPPNESLSAITNFIYTSSGGELNAVINQGNSVGILLYTTDPASGAISSVVQPSGTVATTSLAYSVWTYYQAVVAALNTFNGANQGSNFVLQCALAPPFYSPAEPVILMEGNMMEPVQRNGAGITTFVRLSPEILSQLNITYNGTNFTVATSALSGIPVVGTNVPMQTDVQALAGEAFLITPMLAGITASALAAQGGTNNPAVGSLPNFTTSLMYAQGGLSPLEITPAPGGVLAPPATSLMTTVYSPNYTPAANLAIAVPSPQALNITFTNATTNGWAPNSIGWTSQEQYPEFSASRVDPFMPIFMIWNLQLNPLNWQQDSQNQVYSPTNITSNFSLDNDGVDYQYNMNGSTPVNFTSPVAVTYGNSATMSSNSSGVLVYQITTYISNHPNDPENPTLQKIANLYNSRKFLSQSISGFNIQQILASFVAQVGVENLVSGNRDRVTQLVATAAGATPNDNWYDFSFNNMEPIATGLMAQGNFGPLRSGFMEIGSIEIVDTFGQRMDLFTTTKKSDGALSCITSHAMSPLPTDTVNQGKIYLPPRVLAPTRLWFQWLSAKFDPSVTGINADFVEMNSHPATSPVCGWVMPNHLDNDLFFYNSDGTAIGTFGVEHTGTSPAVVYRTRAGHITNPPSTLTDDIGAPGTPANNVNPTLANYMWYLNGQSAQYLLDLMASIQNSDVFINPSNFSQNAALSVLIGRPLAITRAVVGLETAGNLLPLSQCDDTANSPFPQDVNNSRVNYTDRMNYSSANLGNVQFPLRLGNLANLDDGLVGYIIEGTGSNPYTGATFYTPAATPAMNSGVVQPTATTVQLTLNAQPVPVMMLIDPRAAVHATTGILPVNELSIPPDQYAAIMSKLAVTFTTRPLLQMAQGLVVPLPKESGYTWSWISPGTATVPASNTPLPANTANETPVYGYSPQTIQEGWLELNPEQK